jgi:hypothetical protein
MKNNKWVFVAALLTLLLGSAAFADTADEGTVRTYASVRAVVSVAEGPPPDTNRPRPEGYFQLAGAVFNELCGEVLAAFNEAGRYDGGDGTRWLLDNSHQIDFASLDPKAPPGTQYVFPDLEYVRVDIDADGADEHVYRLNSVLRSQWIQRLMIVPDELQQQSKLLVPYSEECERVDPRADCAATTTAIRYALMAPVPQRLANEWQFTRNSPWMWVTRDDASREQIYVSRNQSKRNIGDDSSANWSLYKVASGVVAVGAPLFFDFAPPELMVFVPSKRMAGNLRCILMPKVWHEPKVKQEEEP